MDNGEPKPDAEDETRARRFLVSWFEAIDEDLARTLALELAKVRDDERQRLQPDCENHMLEAMEIATENERTRVAVAVAGLAGRYTSVKAQREAVLRIVRGEDSK